MKIEMTDKNMYVYLEGEIDHHSAKGMRAEIDKKIEEEMPSVVILDFSAVVFMDSSGIGMVMGRHRKMNFLGGRTFVTGIGDNVDRIFRMSGLYRIIPKYQERTEVL